MFIKPDNFESTLEFFSSPLSSAAYLFDVFFLILCFLAVRKALLLLMKFFFQVCPMSCFVRQPKNNPQGILGKF